MKSTCNRFVFLLLGILLSGKITAQNHNTASPDDEYVKTKYSDSAFRTWSVGVNIGILTFSNILQTNNQLDFTSPVSKLGYGAFVKKQVLPSFGFQAQFFAGSLSSNNSQGTAYGLPLYAKFNTSINYTLSINAVYTIATLRSDYYHVGLQPYVGLGFGFMGYHPILAADNNTRTGFIYTDQGVSNDSFVPAQVGLKFNISRNVNLDFAYQINFAYTNNIDGYKYGQNNDKFSYLHFGLEFGLGNRSKPQLSTYKPSPEVRYEDLSENKTRRNQGPLDTSRKKRTNAVDERLKRLSMDTDSDGVVDFFDRCPNTPLGVKVDRFGCPINDENGNNKKTAVDKDQQVIDDAMDNLVFEAEKATIRESSFPTLNKLADLLIEKRMDKNQPQKILIVSGYGDGAGSYEFNLALSKDRAMAVKTYLTNKGIRDLNIVTVGYAKAYPAASGPDASKKSNRRVELTLY